MDSSETVPELIQTFVRERLRSVEELEALLLLRSQPGRTWTDGEVAAQLKVSPTLVRSALSRLVQGGLCESDAQNIGPTKFAPKDGELTRAVHALAEYYAEHRIEVLVLISQSAISRVRNDALRTFAEAFRVKDRKNDA